MSSEVPPGLPVWVGPSYRRSGFRGVRLAVFADKQPPSAGDIARVGRGLDCTLTGQYIDGTMPHREFTDVARLVLGRAADRPECEDFWRAVAFANAAEPSGGTRRKPLATDEDRQLTQRIFREFLAQVEPQALLVFGASLKDLLAQDPALHGPLGALETRTAVVTHPGTAGFAFRDHIEQARKLGLDASHV